MSRIPTRAARFLINRNPLLVVNLLLLLIGLSTMREMIHLLATPADDSEELVSMATAIATMLYGYGVSLELRPRFLEVFAIYPDQRNAYQEAIDRVCVRYGLLFVFTGLFLEILVQLVEIPSRIINTHGAETALFSVATAALVGTILLLVGFSLRLAQAQGGPPKH